MEQQYFQQPPRPEEFPDPGKQPEIPGKEEPPHTPPPAKPEMPPVEEPGTEPPPIEVPEP